MPCRKFWEVVDPRPLVVLVVFFKCRLWWFMPTPEVPDALGYHLSMGWLKRREEKIPGRGRGNAYRWAVGVVWITSAWVFSLSLPCGHHPTASTRLWTSSSSNINRFAFRFTPSTSDSRVIPSNSRPPFSIHEWCHFPWCFNCWAFSWWRPFMPKIGNFPLSLWLLQLWHPSIPDSLSSSTQVVVDVNTGTLELSCAPHYCLAITVAREAHLSSRCCPTLWALSSTRPSSCILSSSREDTNNVVCSHVSPSCLSFTPLIRKLFRLL